MIDIAGGIFLGYVMIRAGNILFAIAVATVEWLNNRGGPR